MRRKSVKQAGHGKANVGPKAPQRARVRAQVALALAQTVDGALCAYVALFGLPDLPAEGLDVALRRDWNYRASKTELAAALETLVAKNPELVKRLQALQVEALVNDLAIAAAALGWKLGIAARGAARRDHG